MFRQSPYYNEARQLLFNDTEYDISKNMLQMKLTTPDKQFNKLNVKKSTSKQEFMSFFNRKIEKNTMMESELLQQCSYCSKDVLSCQTQCVECSQLVCQPCTYQCYYCGNLSCIVCSNRIYLPDGDFFVCLQCIK